MPSNPSTLLLARACNFVGHTLAVKPDKSQKQGELLMNVISSESGEWLEKVEFVDEMGNAIKADEAGSARADSLTQYIALNPDAKTAGLRVTYFAKLEDVKQPIDMKIGLGLP